MSRHFFCPACGHELDTYTQHVGKHAVDFGTCRVEGCTLEGQTLSVDTWQRFLTDEHLRATYRLETVRFNPLTGERLVNDDPG